MTYWLFNSAVNGGKDCFVLKVLNRALLSSSWVGVGGERSAIPMVAPWIKNISNDQCGVNLILCRLFSDLGIFFTLQCAYVSF